MRLLHSNTLARRIFGRLRNGPRADQTLCRARLRASTFGQRCGFERQNWQVSFKA